MLRNVNFLMYFFHSHYHVYVYMCHYFTSMYICYDDELYMLKSK